MTRSDFLADEGLAASLRKLDRLVAWRPRSVLATIRTAMTARQTELDGLQAECSRLSGSLARLQVEQAATESSRRALEAALQRETEHRVEADARLAAQLEFQVAERDRFRQSESDAARRLGHAEGQVREQSDRLTVQQARWDRIAESARAENVMLAASLQEERATGRLLRAEVARLEPLAKEAAGLGQELLRRDERVRILTQTLSEAHLRHEADLRLCLGLEADVERWQQAADEASTRLLEQKIAAARAAEAHADDRLALSAELTRVTLDGEDARREALTLEWRLSEEVSRCSALDERVAETRRESSDRQIEIERLGRNLHNATGAISLLEHLLQARRLRGSDASGPPTETIQALPKLALAGGFSSGKSSFLNSLFETGELGLGDEPLLAVGLKAVTRLPCHVIAGSPLGIWLHDAEGGALPISHEQFTRLSHGSSAWLSASMWKGFTHVTVRAPSRHPLLKRFCLIDTPGYNAELDGSADADSDRARAIAAVQAAKGLIWLVGVDVSGTIGERDLSFIERSGHRGARLLVLLTKADTKPRADCEDVRREVQEQFEVWDIEASAVALHSSESDAEELSAAQPIERLIASLLC